MKGMTEEEAKINGISARYAFVFTTLSLMVWSIVQYVKEKDTGWQFSIMIVSVAIFFITKLVLTKKTLRRS